MRDVIIIGGSYAGLAAALTLGRARRSVLVVDAGHRRNRFASASHGFLGQDGASPADIAAKGKAEVLAYPTVTWLEATVTGARPSGAAFVVQAGGDELLARRVILATGVVDELPDIAGLEALWGKSVFQCPYCDGYELEMGKLGALATSSFSAHHAALVAEWGARGETTFFAHDGPDADPEQLALLASRGIRIERERVVAAAAAGSGIELTVQDGRTSRLAALFLVTRTHVPGRLAEELGCALEAGPTGSFYKTDATKETTVPGVFACGDAALMQPSISFAVADGVRAGASAHQSLVFRPVGTDAR